MSLRVMSHPGRVLPTRLLHMRLSFPAQCCEGGASAVQGAETVSTL